MIEKNSLSFEQEDYLLECGLERNRMSKDHDGISLWYLLVCPICYNRKWVSTLKYNIYCNNCENLMEYWKDI